MGQQVNAPECGAPFCRKPLGSGNRYGGTTGRPAKYCDDRCRQAAYRWRKNKPCEHMIRYQVEGTMPGGQVACEGKIGHSGDHFARVWVRVS